MNIFQNDENSRFQQLYVKLKSVSLRMSLFQIASNISFWATVKTFFQSPTSPKTRDLFKGGFNG